MRCAGEMRKGAPASDVADDSTRVRQSWCCFSNHAGAAPVSSAGLCRPGSEARHEEEEDHYQDDNNHHHDRET
ncbi:hypothetical protein CEXT_659991 [Caerostris extrusa]|uniref:Uncharacterized protein n=1 Tax=Caerostris extrusa TaxID=172846 RepID=A0AAV4MHE9_CAEEX|nr:hypothetical protein CEXT_659991 [Caerostris extrusa]